MGIKSFNPYTPSRRHMTSSDFNEITKSTPEKSLVVSLKKNAGRNNQGKITVRHRGGGSRRKYRIIDFKRRKDGIPATVVSIDRVRSEQNSKHRSDLLCRRRESIHPGSGRTESCHEGYERRCCRGKTWKLPAAVRDSGWYHGSQRRASCRQRRTACSCSW